MIIVYEENGITKLVINVNVTPLFPDSPSKTKVTVQNLAKRGKVKAFTFPRRLVNLNKPVELSSFLLADIARVDKTKPPAPKKLAVKKKKRPRIQPTGISYISSFGKCGIATYTGFLSRAMLKYYPVWIYRTLGEANTKSLIHVQIEFGIFPLETQLLNKKFSQNYKIATWHTVLQYPFAPHLGYYQAIDQEYDAHIVHDILGKKWLEQYMNKPVYWIPHAAVAFTPTDKLEARKKLGLPLDSHIIFSFGFASSSKGFAEVLHATKKIAKNHKKFLAIISGAKHGIQKRFSEETLRTLKPLCGDTTLLLGKFLTETEINLYASACDILIFNYSTPKILASASGAVKRVLAAGKPIVCSIDNRLIDLVDGHHCLKFPQEDMEEMRRCIEFLLENPDIAETLGRNARQYALSISWENIAKKHLKVYEAVAWESLTV